MSENNATHMDVTEARQGRRGRHALIVLVASTTLGILALLAAWAYYSNDMAGKRGNREAPPQVARTVHDSTAGAVARQNDGPTPPTDRAAP